MIRVVALEYSFVQFWAILVVGHSILSSCRIGCCSFNGNVPFRHYRYSKQACINWIFDISKSNTQADIVQVAR